jgi:hypothetical protein
MFTHFHYNKLTLKETRLIHFADQPEGPKVPKVPKTRPEAFQKTGALTKDQERRIRRLGLQESQFKGPSALDARIVDKLYKCDILRDGTYPKDPQNPYYLLMKAIADGKFPNRGTQIPRFLKAIEGGENEREQVLKILKETYLHSGPLTEKSQDKYLAQLDEAQSKDIVATAKKEAEDAVSRVETDTEAAETKGRIGTVAKEALEDPSTAERVEKGFMQLGNWEVEAPREGLIKELQTLAERYRKNSKQYRKAYKECEKAAAELQTPGLDQAKKDALTAKIHNLEQEKVSIERDMARLKIEAEKAKEEYSLWVKKTLKMFQRFETLLSETGIDVLTATKLKRWLFNQTALADNTTSSLELEGVKSDQDTGLSTKKYGNITIRKVYFDPLELSDTIPQEGEIKEAIGQLMIEFEDENGQTSTDSYTNFVRMVDAEEIHEEIANMDELNYRIAMETRYKALAEGDKFEAPIVLGFDKEGEKVYGTRTFTVEKIDNQKGEPVIILDHSLTKTPKEKLAYTIHPSLYFDREQQDFSPGEFAKLLKQYKFQRVRTPQDTTQKILDGATAHQQETLRRLNLPTDVVGHTTLPKPGEPPRETVVYSDTGEPQKGYIWNLGDDRYDIEVLQPDLETDVEAIVAPQLAKEDGIKVPAELTQRSYRIERRPLAADSNMAIADKGNVAPAAEGHGGEAHGGEEHAEGHEEKHAESHEEEHPEVHKKSKDEEMAEAEEETKKMGGREVKPEALPYHDIHKTGGVSYPQRGILKRIWDDTRVLSFSDLFAMGKTMYDYYERRWDRRQKEKYSTVGEDLPFFGSEMRRVKQAAENEEVHQFHESFAQKGVFEIEERLVQTSNRDEFKACIEDLCEKGHMRWDLIDFWKNLNRFVNDPRKLVPIPSNGDPYTIVNEREGTTGLDHIQGAIDSLWGEGTYDHLVSKDKSTRQSAARSWYEKGKEVEIIPGGHQKVLEKLLRKHRNGEFVDPNEYEGLIIHMIDAGKSSMQAKLYYIVAGAAATNHHGHTILSFDRVGHINSEMLAQFPVLEYMTAAPLRKDGERHKWTLDDYKRFLAYFEKNVTENGCVPTKEVDHFLWRYVVPSYENETRVNKDLRNADKLDHDDMFAYLPPASSKILENACRTVGGGGKHLLTIEGYANAAPGFSQYFKSLAHFGNSNRLLKALQSYVRFEAIMMNRWEKDNKDFARMDKNILTRKTVVSDTPPIIFFNELNKVMRKIAEAYNIPELNEAIELIQTDTSGWDMSDKNTQARQIRIQHALANFDSLIERVTATDDCAKAMQVINESKLEGMNYEHSHDDYSAPAPIAGEEFHGLGGGHGHGGHH